MNALLQEFIQKRVIANFAAADPDYGARIAKKIAALKAKGTISLSYIDVMDMVR